MTILGWLAAVIGGISLPFRLLQLVAVAAQPDEVRARLPVLTHPVQTFAADNLVLMAILYLFAAALLLVVGMGLIRRQSWALLAGAVWLISGAFHQTSSLVVAISGSSPIPGELDPVVAARLANVLIFTYLLSLLWLAFLFWFFRRPSIRSEFSAERSAA